MRTRLEVCASVRNDARVSVACLDIGKDLANIPPSTSFWLSLSRDAALPAFGAHIGLLERWRDRPVRSAGRKDP